MTDKELAADIRMALKVLSGLAIQADKRGLEIDVHDNKPRHDTLGIYNIARNPVVRITRYKSAVEEF